MNRQRERAIGLALVVVCGVMFWGSLGYIVGKLLT